MYDKLYSYGYNCLSFCVKINKLSKKYCQLFNFLLFVIYISGAYFMELFSIICFVILEILNILCEKVMDFQSFFTVIFFLLDYQSFLNSTGNCLCSEYFSYVGTDILEPKKLCRTHKKEHCPRKKLSLSYIFTVVLFCENGQNELF